MTALVHTDLAANLHVSDLPYRFSSWAFDHPDNVRLWVDETGQLVAWVVLQTPFWAVDYAVSPDAPPWLHRRLLAWADRRMQAARGTASARPMWFIYVFSDQQQRIDDLEAAGWACQANVGENSWSKVFMGRSLDSAPAELPIPAGFAIRPLAGPSEVAAYVALHRAVFESESMTEAWRHRTLQQRGYIPTLDLVAVAPDGRLAAFCICWFDPHCPTGRAGGQIEPLGVHADFRGQRLGRAILTEGVRRLRQHGAQDAVVETDDHRHGALAVYEATGFRVTRNVLVYRKNVEE
ncbi:MAG TPA: GNAT family N-acetyltransferase [Ardenticatenaceae bacterium]|nr:GNAT family N-acetyltransferase [Ardenticatenaceae bacterium]